MALSKARVCVNGHLQPSETSDGVDARDLCPKCHGEIWHECSCGCPLLGLLPKDYRPINRMKALPGRDFCPRCRGLYPWVRSWLLRPIVTEEFSDYERDIARYHVAALHPSPRLEDYGLTSQDISHPIPRTWLNRMFGGGTRVQNPSHPKYREWLAYESASSKQAELLQNATAEIARLRNAAHEKQAKELERESAWRKLSGQQFERQFAELLCRRKYNVTHTGGPGDQGADIILETKKGRIVVQCKAYAGKVGPQPVRDLCGSMLHHRATEGWLVAFEGFSDSAYEFAYGKPIKLLLLRSFLSK